MRKFQINKFYVLTMTLAFVTRIGDYIVSRYFSLLIAGLWILYGVYSLLRKYKGTKEISKTSKYLFIYFFLPVVIIHIYTILLMIAGVVDFNLITTNSSIYVPVLFTIISFYLFKLDTPKYLMISLLLSWVITIISTVLVKGPMVIVDNLSFLLFGGEMGTFVYYFELHDTILAIGFVFIFYFLKNQKMKKIDYFISVGLAVAFLFGLKRIAVVALLVIVGYWFIMKRLPDKYKYRFEVITGVAIIFFSFLFLFIVSSFEKMEFLTNLTGIDTMGRIYYYDVIMSLTDFSISFLGLGRNVVSHILVEEHAYLNVAGVHSDIVKMYAENGFIMFSLWITYYLLYLPHRLKSKFSFKVTNSYFLASLYLFILYFTDNVENYFICQIIFLMIPFYFIYEFVEKNKTWSS